MRRWLKKWLCVLSAALLLWAFPCGAVCAAETTTVPAETTVADTGLSKPVKVVGFLVIFTVTCGATTFFVMRSRLKTLRAEKETAVQNKTES